MTDFPEYAIQKRGCLRNWDFRPQRQTGDADQLAVAQQANPFFSSTLQALAAED